MEFRKVEEIQQGSEQISLKVINFNFNIFTMLIPPLPLLLPPPLLLPLHLQELQLVPHLRHQETRALRLSYPAFLQTIWAAWLENILSINIKQGFFNTFWSFGPVVHLFFPGLLQEFSTENIPTLKNQTKLRSVLHVFSVTYTLVQLASVIVCSGVGSPFVLGVHADLGLKLRK